MSVGYGHLLTHCPIKFVTRRSEIVVTSTLQLTLTPADCGYQPIDHALMSKDEIQKWVENRCIYAGECTEYQKAVFEIDAALYATMQ